MEEARDPGDERLDEMLTRLSTLAKQPEQRPADGGRRKAVAAAAVLLLGIGGIVAWRVSAGGESGTDSSADESAPSAAASDGTSELVVVDTVAPTSPATEPVSTEPPAPTSTEPAEIETTTTVAATTTEAAPPTTVALELLTGVPKANLPGGQPWPNGLYQDDILYIRGTLPSKEVADALEARVVAILGRDFVVNEVQIDPTVPMVETVLLRLGNSVLFKSGDFDVPPESEFGFQLWALFLSANPDVNLTIIGYTDNVGSEDYNIELATKRAEVARDLILSNEATVLDQISVVGLGPADPLGDNQTVEGRQLNRRVEFAVTGLFAQP